MDQKPVNHAVCPEIDILIQNRPVNALIDAGSKITCISESTYDKYIEVFRTCPTLTSLRFNGREIRTAKKADPGTN